MNIKHLAALATAIIATSTFAGSPAEKKCSAGTCSKKEVSSEKKDASCSKKEASAEQKDASCSKKETSCSKKETSCSKK
ncbi:hypothetical protein LG201_08860 [Methylobacillus gramineus]|uniref:hypothetical protein n=1 Tax=Methylobacillus gramineus TaxID=755169 RepID=UPI001CFFF055|nr:hypothetical protein [Methylobacillus gramineus]MCB5185313.1 hypothetical protein [Methylobacillus gramineus]